MAPLEDLLQQCTVKITVPGSWGTGFFVTPRLILTCAHVVRKAADLQVTVSYPAWQQPLSAIVKTKADDGKTLDLALIELSELLLDHPCVLLDEEEVAIGQALYSYGYLESYTNAAPVCPVNEGLTGDTPPLLKLQGAQIENGISGAALLNLKTGKVCGMVKETRAAGFDLGGGAIPTHVILEQFPELRSLQQVFHKRDHRWINLITQPGIDFQPYLQAILANEDYREWQERMSTQVTVTVSERRFSSRLKLLVETVKPDKQEQGNQLDGAPELQEQVEQWDVLTGLRNYAKQHVVLIGKPGSGKSTSLKQLLWEEAEKALQYPNAQIPVLVKLRRCTGTIEGLIRDFLAGHQVALDIAQVEELLRQGRFLLLLDGLNELPKDFETEVANFRDRYRRTTPMIVSTRDFGGRGTLGIEKVLKMLSLTEPQMREFVRGYLGEEGDRLFQQLQGDRLRKFAEIPLLLWMLCRVFDRSGQVPDNLGLAFREFAHLHDQELQADAQADSKKQWPKLLRHLAFVMMQGKALIDPQFSIPEEKAEDYLTAYLRQEDRSNPREVAERWLQDLLKYHLIQPVIQPNFEKHIEFRHQLIQEYYAAEYLLNALPDLTNDQLKRDYLNYSKWTEPVALMLALEDNEARAVQVIKLALDVDLMLGARLTGEVQSKNLQRAVAHQAIRQVRFLINQTKNTKLPNIGHEIYLLSLTKSEIVLGEIINTKNRYNNGISKMALASVMDHFGEPAILKLDYLQKDNDPQIRAIYARSLSKIPSEKSVKILFDLLEDTSSKVRVRSMLSLSDLLVEMKIKASDYLERFYRELDLFLITRNQDICAPAIIALAKLSAALSREIPECLDNFFLRIDSILSNSEPEIRKLGLISLTKITVRLAKIFPICFEEFFKRIDSLLSDSDVGIYNLAIVHLAQVSLESGKGDSLHTQQFFSRIDLILLEHSPLSKMTDHTFEQVIKNLRGLGNIQTIKKMGEFLRIRSLGRIAAENLADIRTEESLNELIKALGSSCYTIRKNAVQGLFFAGSEQKNPYVMDAVDGLIEIINDSRSHIPGVDKLRGLAVATLANISPESAIGCLAAILRDKQFIKHHLRIIERLGKFGSSKSIELITELGLTHSESNVRKKSFFALRRLIGEEEISTIIKTKDYPNEFNDIPSFNDSSSPQPDMEREESKKSTRNISQVIDEIIDGSRQSDPSNEVIHAKEIWERSQEILKKDIKDIEISDWTKKIPALKNAWIETGDKKIKRILCAIQLQCKFYNYEIWQEAETMQKAKLEMQTEG